MPYKTKEARRAAQVKWRQKNPDKVRANARKFYDTNKERVNVVARQRNKTPERRAYFRRYKEKLRNAVLDRYGRACGCCGETNPEFLEIDHVNGDGNTHRRELGMRGGSSFYRWLSNNSFPDGFRTLCSNCNQSLGRYGYCPHQKQNGEIQMSFQTDVAPEDESLPEAGDGHEGSGSVSVLGYNIPVSYCEGGGESHSSPISRPVVTDL